MIKAGCDTHPANSNTMKIYLASLISIFLFSFLPPVYSQNQGNRWIFDDGVEIDFNNRLTILTGANGSGKTTILRNILARHSGWNTLSCATPKKDKISGLLLFFTRLFNGEDKKDDKRIDNIIASVKLIDNE